MLVDLFSNSDIQTFNINLAHTLGLNNAIYISEILNIYKKACNKSTIDENGFIKVDRKYIQKRTTLSETEQLKADDDLSKLNIITKETGNLNKLNINIALVISLITNEDIDTIKTIQKSLKVKTKTSKEEKLNGVIKNMQNSVDLGLLGNNSELITSVYTWIATICEYKKPLTKDAINIFINTMNNYAQGNLDVALDLLNIGIVHQYRDCSWCINAYEREIASKRHLQLNNPISNRVFEDANESDIGKAF